MENCNMTFGVLNFKRNLNPMTMYELQSIGKLIICSDKTEDELKEVSKEFIYIKADESVAKSKNSIIMKAREISSDYLFIIEDDMIIKDSSAFYKYIAMMQKYKIGFVFYGFGSIYNKIFTGMPNPCLTLKLDNDGTELMFNRFSCTSMIGIDIKNNLEMFDEELKMLELDEYNFRCYEKALVPFTGFYFDIPFSYKYFARENFPRVRMKDMALIDKDREIIRQKHPNIAMENVVDKVISYIETHK